ncbi:prealbumin-like fold domain-containing protein [Comamonas koreensis]|uniref:DUF11 domain-containing protein n=1 Tax=Comamonas koreensis TaxID=160825 RepID=A0AAW4XWT7_9BURK|nr:DUF5979 domain-containing protein [Comamonas koreensis]MCD2166133.1 DUF11 domain-containing protein [Comamonas koreensis]
MTFNFIEKKILKLCFLAFSFLFLPAFAQAQTADLQITKTGPVSANGGDAFQYVLTVDNNGPNAAAGANVVDTLPPNLSNVAAVCVSAINGAACPGSIGITASTVTATIPAFPALGRVVFHITGNFPASGPSSITNTARVDTPAGVTDPDMATNTSVVSTVMSYKTDLAVSKTQSSNVFASGVPITYTMTVQNNGPASADGASIQDSLTNFANYNSGPPYDYLTITNSFVSCTASGGAVCPANSSFNSQSATGIDYMLFSTSVPTLPAGGSLRIIYTMTPTITGAQRCGTGAGFLQNEFRASVPAGMTDSDYNNNAAQVSIATPQAPNCPQSDLAVTKTQSSNTFSPGVPVTYTMTLVNNGPNSADGTNIRDAITSFANYNAGSPYDYMNINASFVDCSAAGGAVCPDDANFNNISATGIDYNLFDTSVPRLPVGGAITIVYTMTPTIVGTQRCSSGAGFIQNEFRATLPSGMTDSNYNNNASQVSISTPRAPDCPQTDLEVTKTQSSNVFVAGQPITYTMTLRNHGPNPVDQVQINDSITNFANYTYGSPYQYINTSTAFVSCSAAGGAVCPDASTFGSPSQAGIDVMLFNTSVPKLPVGGTVTVVYTMTPTALPVPSCGNSASSFIQNTFSATLPAGYVDVGPGSNSASVSLPVSCADISVNKKVEPVTTSVSGSAVVYTIDVANATGSAAASNVAFSDPLPSGFVYGNAVCTAQTPNAVCGPVSYDATSRTVTSTIQALPEGGIVRFVITGSAGNTAGTYANTASAAVAPGWLDPVPASNSSTVNLQIFNTSSPITVTKKVAGLPAAGMPVAMTFTGTVVCGAQAPQKWSATVAAGAASGDSAPLSFYDKDACTVTEDAPPAAPNGYVWVGMASIAPNPTNPLGPTTPLTVVVTNTLSALPPGKVTITKVAQTTSGAPATSTASFSFAGTGAGVPATLTVLTQGGTGSQTIADLAAGQTYTWTEGALNGWALASLQCTDQNGASPKSTITTDLALRQLSVVLASGEELVCTFTNRETETTTPPDPFNGKLKAVPVMDASKLLMMMLAVAALGVAGLRRTQRR